MKRIILPAIFLTLAAFVVPAWSQETESKDYTEFSKLLHQLVAKQVPKEIEDKSGWGPTIPLTERLRLPNLRTYIKVGDQTHVPHGFWKRYRAVMEDPQKDLKIRVKSFEKAEGGKFKIQLKTAATVKGEGHVQHWQKGLATIGISVFAEAQIQADIDCDVAVSLNTSVFPPELVVEPKITDCKLTLKEFALGQIARPIDIQPGRDLGNDLKGFMQQMLTAHESDVKDLANRAIAQSIKDGKGKLSGAELLKVLKSGCADSHATRPARR